MSIPKDEVLAVGEEFTWDGNTGKYKIVHFDHSVSPTGIHVKCTATGINSVVNATYFFRVFTRVSNKATNPIYPIDMSGFITDFSDYPDAFSNGIKQHKPTKLACNCASFDLFNYGCKCGAFIKESSHVA